MKPFKSGCHHAPFDMKQYTRAYPSLVKLNNPFGPFHQLRFGPFDVGAHLLAENERTTREATALRSDI